MEEGCTIPSSKISFVCLHDEIVQSFQNGKKVENGRRGGHSFSWLGNLTLVVIFALTDLQAELA